VIPIKSQREIGIMDRANVVVREVLEVLEEAVLPGTSTEELDRIADTEIRRRGAVPAFKGYYGYPKSLCASINDEVVHGIPTRKRKLQEGDIVGLDLGAIVEGYYGDAAVTVGVGRIGDKAKRLLESTRKALTLGIAEAIPGAPLHAIGRAVQNYAESKGYGVVREYVGHGIGTSLHEEPQVPNYWPGKPGPTLREGMVLALEPMLNAGSAKVVRDSDGWTVRTADGSLSAHFEHSIVVTAEGPRILGAAGQPATAEAR
jgi:methionyl aminopeptidase